jgi:hypothetical protein
MATVQFEIQSYALELGVRSQAINNNRAIVPFHQLMLQGTVAGGPISVVMQFWLGIEQPSPTGPTEVGTYNVPQRRAVIKAAFIDFLDTYEVVRSEKPVYCSFTHTDSGPPSLRTIMSSALSTQAEPLGEGPVDQS